MTKTKKYTGPTVQAVLDSLYVSEGVVYVEVSRIDLPNGMVEVEVRVADEDGR